MVSKKKEYDCSLSPSALMLHSDLSSADQDTWLLSRLSPNIGCSQATIDTNDTTEQETDSGLDSLQEEKVPFVKENDKELFIQSDEIQEVKLNMKARNCTSSKPSRPKIPSRLCKVTKV